MVDVVRVVQPYVPEYRRTFFDLLSNDLEGHGLVLEVWTGEPALVQAERRDASTGRWHRHLRNRTISVAGVGFVTLDFRVFRGSARIFVFPLQASRLDTLLGVLLGKVLRFKTVVWGHAQSYVNTASALDQVVERGLMKLADRVFVYTLGGEKYARSKGIASHKITVVQNSTDTRGLVSSIRHLGEGRRSGKTVTYIGGLDPDKRVDLFAQALDAMWELDRSVTVIVAGSGTDEWRLHRAADRGQVVLTGTVGTLRKAEILSESSLILMPGRVGLLAVDALASGVPILTCSDSFHGPELEYLTENHSVFYCESSSSSFADSVLTLLSRECLIFTPCDVPSVEEMTTRFREGLLATLLPASGRDE